MDSKPIITLDKEYDFFFEKIKSNENFMLLRYGDGERSIMLGNAVKAQEGWTSPAQMTPLGAALLETLKIPDDRVYYGVSCPCCDQRAYFWYCTTIKNENITFANLFVNKNYRRFISDFETLKRDAIVIGNRAGEGKRIGNLNILKYYSVGDQCQEFWTNESQGLIDKIIREYGDRNNLLYVVAAGPMAEPIMAALYANNPNNCYIDFGSSIDKYIHLKDTRPYVDPDSEFGSRNCWMYDRKQVNMDVSVVLTTYKKPEALEKQLNALCNQSLRPKEIFLFQDWIDESYSISYKETLLSRFDKVKICTENQGVWKRFEFARSECNGKYVCIFDDDTIPGERWLENCFVNMLEKEGVYGTVGIVVDDYTKYPFAGFTRVGWHNPYQKRTIVDFVGHSWFLKKDYLEYMFDGTEKYQCYKRAAEDMCLSFKCKQHGIATYVPPHPYYDQTMWGSLPQYGMKYGQVSTAISQNSEGCKSMRAALRDYVQEGWRFVLETDRDEALKGIRGAKKDKWTANIKKVVRRLRRIGNKCLMRNRG